MHRVPGFPRPSFRSELSDLVTRSRSNTWRRCRQPHLPDQRRNCDISRRCNRRRIIAQEQLDVSARLSGLSSLSTTFSNPCRGFLGKIIESTSTKFRVKAARYERFRSGATMPWHAAITSPDATGQTDTPPLLQLARAAEIGAP